MPPTKKPASNKAAPRSGDPEIQLINSLAEILNNTGLTEIELDRKGIKVRVSKSVTTVATVSAAPSSITGTSASMAAAHSHAASASEAAQSAATKAAGGEVAGTVKSPMVGTVYLAPTPGAANFVEVGAAVKEGQTLLIIEAMKTMNQIHAPRSGKVTQIFVENGRPVEYGEPLLAIE